jgi:hypothetical protein
MRLPIALTYEIVDMVAISCGVWGNMAYVNFVPKVIGVDMGLQ